MVAQGADLAGLAPRLLGRHVGRGAHDGAGAGLLGVPLHLLGQAEVGDLGLAVERQQDVGRLQVAVDDAPRVCLGHRATKRHHHRRRRSRRLRLAADGLGEAAPGDEFQGEVRQPLVVAVLVNLDDTRVLDLGDGAGLDVEPSDLVARGVRPGQDHLQRDQAIQPDVPGLVNDAHAASADLRDDLVARHGQPGRPRRPARGRSPADRRVGRGGGFVRRRVVRRVREDVHRPGSRVRRATSAGRLRADRRGHVERFAHAGRTACRASRPRWATARPSSRRRPGRARPDSGPGSAPAAARPLRSWGPPSRPRSSPLRGRRAG